MVRQCAWCLRLINSVGERTSLLPMPKIYEATHGICTICGMAWLEAMTGNNGGAMAITRMDDGRYQIECSEEVLPVFPTVAPSPLPENEEQTYLEVTPLAV